MRKGIVAAVVAVGALMIPAAPAAAGHCEYPSTSPNPWERPVDYLVWQVRVSEYLMCELLHR
jgi:hypothetical protein